MYLLASSVKELFVLSLYPTIVLDALMQRADEDVRDPSMQRGARRLNNSHWALNFGGIEVMPSQQRAAK